MKGNTLKINSGILFFIKKEKKKKKEKSKEASPNLNLQLLSSYHILESFK